MKPHYDELVRLAPVKLTLGNYDTYRGENDLSLFRRVFEDTPVTYSFETKGVAFIIANGGRLVGRIFRRVGKAAGYTLAPLEVSAEAQPLLLPFENRDDVL